MRSVYILSILLFFLFASFVYAVEQEMYQLDLELRDEVIVNKGIELVLVNILELKEPKSGYKIEVLEGENVIYTKRVRIIKKIFVHYSKYADTIKVYNLDGAVALTVDVSDFQQVRVQEEMPGILRETGKLKNFLFVVTGSLIFVYIGLYFIFINRMKK